MSDLRHQLADALANSWQTKARPNQRLPEGDWWSIWLLLSGRGFGKTRVLAEMANYWTTTGQYGRIAAIAATASDARDVLVEGESGILACAPSWCRPQYQAMRRQVTWPNGALCTLYTAEEPDRLRGPQHDAMLMDELGSWRNPETFDMAMFGLRLGKRPLTIVATTPRPTKLIRELVAREGRDVVITRGSSYENAANLAPVFFQRIVAKYEGTRLGRQELNAELLEDVPGALWRWEMIERARQAQAPDLQRVVVAIDPAMSTHEGSDETGIIVAGKDDRGHGYVLADLSGKYPPHEWARAAIGAYRSYGADRIVAEVNQGGEMVESTLRMIDQNVAYTAVHASRGKYIRAEPVSSLYEQAKIHHIGTFEKLEDQLTSFTPDIDRAKLGSPDRGDALVFALTELLVAAEPYAGLFQFYAQELARDRAEAANRAGAAAPPSVLHDTASSADRL